ncbi:MAG: prohibitin family protein [Bacteroidota bacterium]
MNRSRVLTTALIVLGGFFLLVLLTSGAFITIEAGYKGVIFRKFGGGLDTENVYGQGFHMIAPWNTMIEYDVREQIINQKNMTVLSSDGLNINLDVSVRFRPQADKIGELHEEIGRGYKESIVEDLTRSTVRRIIGRYTPEDIYRLKREEIETTIQSELQKTLSQKNIILESALLRNIDLPEQIKIAIQDKLKAKEQADKKEFEIDLARKEAERVKIEAQGKADANRILSASLTDKILTEKGIQATLRLAESQGSKVIVVGSGDSGLPLILGNQ